jgi:hypothetical protein
MRNQTAIDTCRSDGRRQTPKAVRGGEAPIVQSIRAKSAAKANPSIPERYSVAEIDQLIELMIRRFQALIGSWLPRPRS